MREIELLEQEILIDEKELELQKKKLKLLKLKEKENKSEIASPKSNTISSTSNEGQMLYYTPKTRQRGTMKIKGMDAFGQFKTGTGHVSTAYDINTIITLKNSLPTLKELQDSGENVWAYLSEKLQCSSFLATQLCLAIENGVFDKYIDRWESDKLKWEKLI